MTVVAAFELNNFVTSRIAPSKADGTHRCFCARVDHANQFHAWNDAANFIS